MCFMGAFERATGIEPALPPWEGGMIPFHHARKVPSAAWYRSPGPVRFIVGASKM